MILKLALISLVLTGGWIDLRVRRLPNWLSLSGLILGLGLNTLVSHAQGFQLSLEGLGLALLIYIPLYLVRAMGAGDVKFMAAIGSIAGPGNWLDVFLTTAILGGLASLGLVTIRNRLHLTITNVSTIAYELAHGRLPFRRDPSLDVHDKKALGLPHGTVIAISVCIFLAFLYHQT